MVRGGQTLLKDVSMHIHCGQITALIGQNGAGKTTLIRALLGQLPHGGSIHHLDGQGRDIPHLRTGYVPQHLDFDKEMPLTVEDFLAAAFSCCPVWTGISKKTRAQVMGSPGGGWRPRPLPGIPWDAAPAVKPSGCCWPWPPIRPRICWVLDQPAPGVDQKGLQLFLDTVLRLKEKHHMAILLVSHDLRLVRKYADHAGAAGQDGACPGKSRGCVCHAGIFGGIRHGRGGGRLMEGIYAVLDAVLPLEALQFSFMKNAFLAILLLTPLLGATGHHGGAAANRPFSPTPWGTAP